MTSYLRAGITLPRVAADQYAAGPTVPLDQAQQGDLLFYAYDVTDPSTIHHVVIYDGGGNIIDAPYTGSFVGKRPLWTDGLMPVAVRPVKNLTLPLLPGSSGWAVGQLQQELNRHGAGPSGRRGIRSDDTGGGQGVEGRARPGEQRDRRAGHLAELRRLRPARPARR